jgi:hypothetical protein
MSGWVDTVLKSLSKRALVWVVTTLIALLSAGFGAFVYPAETAWRQERVEAERKLKERVEATEKRLAETEVNNARTNEAIDRVSEWTRETREDVKEMRRMMEQARREGK